MRSLKYIELVQLDSQNHFILIRTQTVADSTRKTRSRNLSIETQHCRFPARFGVYEAGEKHAMIDKYTTAVPTCIPISCNPYKILIFTVPEAVRSA
jgi:hypothetical protein